MPHPPVPLVYGAGKGEGEPFDGKGANLEVYADNALRLAIHRAVALETTRGWRIAKEKASHKIDVVVALAQAALGAVKGGALCSDGAIVARNLGRSRSRIRWDDLDPQLPTTGGRWSVPRF